ncbi:MAG TPA: Hsp20/alpha crystallin family protein [Nannocystaceae bacterium]|nr:Hsp20/alpha crystallin family protein [Nannocystaceae bacterium]
MSNDKLMKREESQPATEPRMRVVSPPCDVYEDGKEFLILAEMPGIDEGSIDLRLDRNRLTLEAERRFPAHAGQTQASGIRYSRAFEVPDTIDASEIAARLDDGVLSVRLPKAPQARVRQIRVTAG